MSPSRQGIAYGVLAYFLWGLLPLYFKLLAEAAPWRSPFTGTSGRFQPVLW